MSNAPTRDGYWIYEWEEECSGFTPGARWIPGSEYHSIKCRVWIPNDLTEQEDIEAYIERHYEDDSLWVIPSHDELDEKIRLRWPDHGDGGVGYDDDPMEG